MIIIDDDDDYRYDDDDDNDVKMDHLQGYNNNILAEGNEKNSRKAKGGVIVIGNCPS